MSKAREAAARAYDDALWKFDPSVNPVARKALCVNAAIDAFLAQLKADGYKLVRREASYEMTDAGVARLGKDRDNIGCTTTGRLWSAMWDAAPEALTEVKS